MHDLCSVLLHFDQAEGMTALENEMRLIKEKMKDCRTPSFTACSLFNITGGIRLTNRSPVTKQSFALSLIT